MDLFLERLDLSHNQFVGDIPKELGALDKLQALALHHNNLEGTCRLNWAGWNPCDAFLNNNELPVRWLNDRTLNLSNNRITLVPQWATSMKLEWVDLRGNPESNTEIESHCLNALLGIQMKAIQTTTWLGSSEETICGLRQAKSLRVPRCVRLCSIRRLVIREATLLESRVRA